MALVGAGQVEVGQDVRGALLQRSTQHDDLGERLRNAGADGVDEFDHELAATTPVLLAVGGDHPVDEPVPVGDAVFVRLQTRCGGIEVET
jgi:hypothetical protein